MTEGLDTTIPVRVVRNPDVQLANPVLLRITPLTVDMAISNGVIDGFTADNPNSPNRASKHNTN